MKDFIAELEWREMIQDVMPGTKQHLLEQMRSAYVGIDPTADSLHIGHLVSVMMLKHFQKSGHKPYALIGGATGMIGDPSGKSNERNLLGEDTLEKNIEGIKKQLSKFLNFDQGEKNSAELVNNYSWMKDYPFINFIRDIGKHITVNYMMAKDSVKKRFDPNENTDGMSFTEFSYQLLQAYDFLYLYSNKGITLQMGGSDQWGNITTGTELIRRKIGGKAFAMTCPLITKADGTKFGKSEGGNIWLDPEKTSPYKFYQYWLNTSDQDAQRYIKIFTMLGKEQIDDLVEQHLNEPHLRTLQKTLAKEVTVMVHSLEDWENAQKASEILFGQSSAEQLKSLPQRLILEVFEGVPTFEIDRQEITKGLDMVQALSVKTGFLSSNSEVRRALKEGAVSVNKQKVTEDYIIEEKDLIGGRFVILQKGKKNYYLISVK